MKFFTPMALLATALLSVVLALPFLPAAKMRTFVLELTVSSSVDGQLQAYYDDGQGFREALSARSAIGGQGARVVHTLPMPPGNYRALRIDPIDRPGGLTVHAARIVADSGRVVAQIPPKSLQPANQIQSATALPDGSLEITTAPTADDPQVAMLFEPALTLSVSWRDYLRGNLSLTLPIFATLALLLLVLDRAPALRGALARAWWERAQRPRRAVALVAAAAVVVSAYPVIFLGKSFVSPNLGTILLYDEYPTLPGYKSGETTDVKLSDVGAIMWQHVPFSMMQWRAAVHGELPLWNRYNAAGVPLLAQGQSMFGDPLHFMVVALNGASWAWDLKYLIAKWLFATGLGLTVYTLGRRRDNVSGTPVVPDTAWFGAALLVAVTAPFIGFFLYRVNHPAFFSLCYAPWPLYCLVRLAQATTRRELRLWAAGLIVANLALMNSGTVKEAYMLLCCVNFSGGCVLLATAATWRERAIKVVVVGWAGFLFVLLTAPIWMTFLQTLRNAYTGYNTPSAYQIQPTLLLGFFDEIFFRPLMTQNRVFSPSLNFALMAGVLYFSATLRSHFANRAAMALAASSLLPLSLAFGFISPEWIVRLPFLSNIAHVDNTFSCVLIVLWTVLAGVGFAAAAQRLSTREGRGDLVVAGLLLLALVFGWVAFRQAAHRPILGDTFTVHGPGRVLFVDPFVWSTLWLQVGAVVVAALFVRRAFRRRALTPAAAIVLVGCLVVLLWRHGMHAPAVGYDEFTSRPTVRTTFRARSQAMDLARTLHAREPARGFGLRGNFFPGWTGVYGLETVHGPDALVNPWLRELIGVSGVERIWDWRLYVDASNVAGARPFFDALNVRLYFDRHSDQGALGKTLQLVQTADLDVYQSPTAWPRAFFTDRIEMYREPPELIAKIRDAAGRPFAAAQDTDAEAVAALARVPRDAVSRAVAPAKDYRFTENTTSFTVRANGPGVIVLNEAYWPRDFRAESNGHRAPVIRLNHAFKGIVVDAPGEYRVTFRYWPAHFTRNLLLSALGAALLAVSLFFALRPARTA